MTSTFPSRCQQIRQSQAEEATKCSRFGMSRGFFADGLAASPGQPKATFAGKVELGELKQPVFWIVVGIGQVGRC